MSLTVAHLLRVAYLFASCASSHGISADFFRSPDINDDSRHPLAATAGNGDIITVGHFRGTLRQGRRKVCNGASCFMMPNQVYKSQGWADIFLSKYNASHVLQWTRVGGGTGDDRARAVNVDHDGDMLIAGFITGVNAMFNGLELSSRTALSRTIFIAKYSQSGAIKFVKEVASCVIPACDVTSLSQDASGIVLTGTYHARTSFGTQQKCTNDGECINAEKGHLEYTDPGTLKSSGSGQVFINRCWVTKFDTRGDHLWHRDCNDETFQADTALGLGLKTNTYEQQVWAGKAAKFFILNSEDPTGLLGKETNYEDYAKFRSAAKLNTLHERT